MLRKEHKKLLSSNENKTFKCQAFENYGRAHDEQNESTLSTGYFMRLILSFAIRTKFRQIIGLQVR